ncbi:serine hydrolase domain-containing protein [Undibacterium sp.]|uniref:serine hydrolase domain-containing protein n=1 Tax=Undibacterium sp. TaxID=1914977 RepID=UPI00375318EE
MKQTSTQFPSKRFLLASMIACGLLTSNAYADNTKAALPSTKSLSSECANVLKDKPQDGPGTVILLARKGELICSAARGMADIEFGTSLLPQHKLRIGSVSKQFTAAALLKLMDQGKATLDDPLSKYYPKYPDGDKISLRQLLNHTAGVGDITRAPDFIEKTQKIDSTTEDLIKLISVTPVDFAPGAGSRYSNSGYILLSAVIEKITGKRWDQALDELLFKPLNLKDTGWENPDFPTKGLVRSYTQNSIGGVAPSEPLSMTVPQGAGALVSSVKDMWQWNEALHGGKVLSAASYQQMTTPQGAAIKDNYGFALIKREVQGKSALWHSGGINGFISNLIYFPESGISVVQINNSDERAKPYYLQLAASALGAPFAVLKPAKWKEEELKSVQGVFSRDGVNRTIRLVGNELTTQRQGGQQVNLITAAGERLGVAGDILSWFKVERDAQGKVSGLEFHPQGNQTGELWKKIADLPVDTPSVQLNEAQMNRVLGKYAHPQFSVEVVRNKKGGLDIIPKGQPGAEMIAISPNKFRITVVDASFEFDADEPMANSVTLHQGPAVLKMERVKN